MEFGKDSTFDHIEKHIYESGDGSWYRQLSTSIQNDAKMLLRKYNIAEKDRDDIIQEVQISIFKKLPDYVEEFKDKTVQQRNAWLQTIVKNKIKDFLRKNSKRKEDYGTDREYEAADPFQLAESIIQKTELFEVLHQLCGIKTSPDRLLAFLLNKLSVAMDGVNGSPKELAEQMAGKKLQGVYEQVKIQLQALLQYDISDQILQPLWEKVEPYAQTEFQLNARIITDSSSWIGKKLQKAAGENKRHGKNN